MSTLSRKRINIGYSLNKIPAFAGMKEMKRDTRLRGHEKQNSMFKNYIKIAFRNLRKNVLFSLINIVSLSIGLSAAFVIGMMVYYDFTFDTFHPDRDRIYRVVSEFESPEGSFSNSGVPVPMYTATQEELTGIESATFFFRWTPLKVQSDISDKSIKSPNFVIFTEDDYFDIFQYEWLAGAPYDILSSPGAVVLTEDRAQQYFPNIPPSEVLGRTLTYNDSIQTVVKGVVANFTERTDIIFEEFVSKKTATFTDLKDEILGTNWDSTNSNSQVYVKIAANTSLENIQKQLDIVSVKYQDKETAEFGQKQNYATQPLSDIHFNEAYGIYDYSQEQASKTVLYGLGYIALFLLLLGSINFINLNTAQAVQRAKEIGIRKTLGSSRKQLIFQFLGETFLLTLIAGIISIFLSAWLFKIFADFIPNGLDFSIISQPIILVFIVILIIIVTFFSGFYPGLVLSNFKPVRVLKGQQASGSGKSGLRKFLTVFQFTIAQVFIIATLLVGKQIHYIMKTDMGFKTDAIAYFYTPWSDTTVDSREVLLNELQKIPKLSMMSLGGNPPASQGTHSNNVLYRKGNEEIRGNLQKIYGDSEYLELYNIKLIAGRKPLNDTIEELVINEAAMSRFGFESPEEAVGKFFEMNDRKHAIVGVMNNFNQRSLKSDIKPMAFQGDLGRSWRTQFRVIHIALPTGANANFKETLASVETAYASIYPESDFRLRFMDETIARFYTREKRLSTLLNWATGLSVLISCLGLLGLVIHTTERRTKEIGIRKVLGASLTQLNLLLCKDFLILVGLAFIIAAPLAWWGLNSWLQDFAYKTSLSWWIFVLSGLAMIVIALGIMSVRTFATALRNPVKSLRTD
ncbi:MAG: putative ABC transport system permease protein [Dokdonia sp.]|jgi:putative ABC transport system permease protein